MTVTAVEKDLQARILTLTAEFDASPDRVWELWADPRQLERWWGPPSYPATFTAHDLRPGGRMAYHMTGSNGEQFHGWWEVLEVRAASGLVFRDGFAHEDGTPDDSLPVTFARVTIEPLGTGRTQMRIMSEFPSTEAMERVLAMGVEEGLIQAVSQIDGLLAETASAPW